MNPKPLAHAVDADIRLSAGAMQRAALRAHELARKTGTSVIVRYDNKLEAMHPDDPRLIAAPSKR